MSILIVDDSQHSRKLLEAFLKAAGHTEVVAAASAREAFEFLGVDCPGSSGGEVDLILMDVIMPGLDGVAACGQIKAVPSLQDIPIIMVTALEEVEFLKGAFASGAADYVTKPVNKVELLARVRSALNLKQEMDRRKQAYKELENRLLQSQKLASIGRLAGGVAHDFNNMLTGILGYTELAAMALPQGHQLQSDFQEIMKCTKRASTLAHRLLLLSRRRDVEPQELDLDKLISEISRMLQRLIGEDIELVMLLGPDLGLIKADPTCMEQVLMNLAVNSRDAMPKGGKITVETANVAIAPGYSSRQGRIPAGEYVTLSFSDTGTGMTDEVKAHTFEPFFTTKEAGKGTGLGLATCQGIVRQSGGYIEVDSQLGRGTSFRIYLPRVEKAVANQPRVDEVEFDRRPQGTETILLVEDEAAVRTMLSKVLQGQGYTVFQAANGEEGLRLAQRCQVEKVDLLLTDVVMPQMSGTEMASQLRRMHPQIKVLLTSGYTDADIGQHDGLGADTPFIQKPFLPAALARKVREVLDK